MPAGSVPALLTRLDELDRRLDGRPVALFLDFDGTLAPIVDEPEAARLADGMREALEEAARRLTVAVVSGRDRTDVARRVAIDGLFYAGSHGLDIAGPGGSYQHEAALAALPLLDRLELQLRSELASISGALVERKRFTIAAHYRKTPPGEAGRVRDAAMRAVDEHAEIRLAEGKAVFEIRPAVDWDKGDAVEWLLGVLGVPEGEVAPIYAGDDLTDEDAFRALRSREHGIGVLVGHPSELTPARQTLADYYVEDVAEVERLLRHLAELPAS